MPQPVISDALSSAWNEIEQGARRRLEHTKQRLQELYSQETKPPLVGHIKVDDAKEVKTDDKMDDEPERPSQPKQKLIFTTDTEEQLQEVLGDQAAMDERDQQLARTREASDLDLESEMEKDMDTQAAGDDNEKQRDPATSMQEMLDQESTPLTDKDPWDPTQKSAEIATEAEIHESGYGKHYLTGPQEREARNAVRREQRKRKEEKEKREQEEQAAKLAKQAEAEEEGWRVIENALLQEEEEEAKKRLAEICRICKDKKAKKTDQERKKKNPDVMLRRRKTKRRTMKMQILTTIPTRTPKMISLMTSQ